MTPYFSIASKTMCMSLSPLPLRQTITMSSGGEGWGQGGNVIKGMGRLQGRDDALSLAQ